MAIAWIDGQWGSPHALGLPLADRGLQLADGLIAHGMDLEATFHAPRIDISGKCSGFV